MKYEEILERMLGKVTNDVDRREGAIIYDALAPAAAELAQLYAKLEHFNLVTFADEAVGDYLTRRCAERGIDRRLPTCAVREGIFSEDNLEKSSFGIESLIYEVVEKIGEIVEEGKVRYKYNLKCEQSGTIGNLYYGDLLPISGVNNIEKASLTNVVIPGEDMESDEQLRKRYFDSFKSEAFGGNIADYIERTNKIDGVGGVKVYPAHEGGGIVKLVVIDSSYSSPSVAHLSLIQKEVNEFAPIGHIVKVYGVEKKIVPIKINLTLVDGYTWVDVKEHINDAIKEYLLELRKSWANSEQIIVRISKIESMILRVTGVLDVQDTTLNLEPNNLILGESEIPVIGEVVKS